jgi:hypothetical protein
MLTEMPHGTILFPDRIASMLPPYSPDFVYVSARPFITRQSYGRAGREAEGHERALLQNAVDKPKLLKASAHLLNKYGIAYIVTGTGQRFDFLKELNYITVFKGNRYALWVRDSE